MLPEGKLICTHRNSNKENAYAVQVGFGDVWKQSLSELSGGQRSLLALSLILAMLLFKPAPIYILDEVSSAPIKSVELESLLNWDCPQHGVTAGEMHKLQPQPLLPAGYSLMYLLCINCTALHYDAAP